MAVRGPKPINAATAEALPDPGVDRWWVVALAAPASKTPIRVELLESQVEGRRSKAFARTLGVEYAIATPGAVAEAAEMVLAKAGNYLAVIGEYAGGDK